ncbi:hypothetical protein AB0D42_27055 [Streptomyces sp. NPDC048304]|uniref:hypothetical protein n=1 Tax=Streptomyces sp. NPDC048304 TaxID=3154820 RepID=UPI0033D88F9A
MVSESASPSPLGYLITALAARLWDSESVLLACTGMIAAAVVLNLCVPDVYRINRLTEIDWVNGT